MRRHGKSVRRIKTIHNEYESNGIKRAIAMQPWQ